MTKTMKVKYRGQDFEVPIHNNVGFFQICCKCPGSSCLAPQSPEDIIESRTLTLTLNTWNDDERRQIQQEIDDVKRLLT